MGRYTDLKYLKFEHISKVILYFIANKLFKHFIKLQIEYDLVVIYLVPF